MEGYVDYHRSPNASYLSVGDYNDRFGTSIPVDEKYDIYFKEAFEKARENTEEGQPITADIFTIDQVEWRAFVETDETVETQEVDQVDNSQVEETEEVEEGEIDEVADSEKKDDAVEPPTNNIEEIQTEESGVVENPDTDLDDEVAARENALRVREQLGNLEGEDEPSEEANAEADFEVENEDLNGDTESLKSSLSTMIKHAEKTDEMVDSAFKLQEEDDDESIMSLPNSLKTISTDAAHRLEENIKSAKSKRVRGVSRISSTGRQSGAGNDGNYVNTVKFQIRLEKAYAEIEELSKLLQHRDREIRRLKETVYAKESTISGLRSETDAMRQECALLEDSARRAERNNKRKTRQLKNMKDQLNKCEEVNRDLQRKVNSQRSELNTYSETMNLMEQSRQEAEDAADSAQRQLRQVRKQLQMSPQVRSKYTQQNREKFRSPRRTIVGSTRTSVRNSSKRSRATGNAVLPRIDSQRNKKSPNFTFDEVDESLDSWSGRGYMTPPSAKNTKPGRKPDSSRRLVDRYAERDERGIIMNSDYKDPDDRILNTEAARLAASKQQLTVEAKGDSTANDPPKDPIAMATEMNQAAVKVQARARGFLQRKTPPKQNNGDHADENRSVVEAEEELNIASEKGIVEDGEEDENAVAGEVDDGEEVGDEEEEVGDEEEEVEDEEEEVEDEEEEEEDDDEEDDEDDEED